MSYYKKIKGRNYDGSILKIADAAVKGKGDGRLSLADAKKILKTVRDSAEYTDIEKKTMQYVRDNYKFTPEANSWFRTEIRKWAATKGAAAGKPAVKPKTAAKPKKAAADKGVFEEEFIRAQQVRDQAMVREPAVEGKGAGKKILWLLLLLVVILLAVFLFRPIKEFFTGTKPANVEVSKVKTPEAIKPPVIAQKPAVPKVAVPSDKNVYVVQVKDSLIGISETLTGDYRNWVKIYEANKEAIKDPVLIYPGQQLIIPAELTVKK